MPTPAQVTAHAKAWIDVANAIKSAFTLSRELSLHNSVNDPNWNDLANQVPEAVDEDGLVVGTEVTPADVSNAIGSVNTFVVLMDGSGQPAQSAWINNIEKVAKPIV
jgi:hypothetical protein